MSVHWISSGLRVRASPRVSGLREIGLISQSLEGRGSIPHWVCYIVGSSKILHWLYLKLLFYGEENVPQNDNSPRGLRLGAIVEVMEDGVKVERMRRSKYVGTRWRLGPYVVHHNNASYSFQTEVEEFQCDNNML